jgi:hypothetical protein
MPYLSFSLRDQSVCKRFIMEESWKIYLSGMRKGELGKKLTHDVIATEASANEAF